MLFGPAYKGIPLVTATAIALAERHQRNVPWAFNRKEAKDHGESGLTVGSPLAGRVVIVDDVITAGTAIRESIELIRRAGAQPVAVALALDRQERGRAERSAVQEARRTCTACLHHHPDAERTHRRARGAPARRAAGARAPRSSPRCAVIGSIRGHRHLSAQRAETVPACAAAVPAVDNAITDASRAGHASEPDGTVRRDRGRGASSPSTLAPGQTYRWTDDKGVVHYGDSVPSEFAQNERSVLNGQGVEVSHVGGPQDAAELASRRTAAELARSSARSTTSSCCRPTLSAKDIEQLRDERLAQIDGQIKASSSLHRFARHAAGRLAGTGHALQALQQRTERAPHAR